MQNELDGTNEVDSFEIPAVEEPVEELPVLDSPFLPTNPKVSYASSYGTWVSSRGTRMSYYLYSNGGGLARFSTMQKKLTSYNSYFNTYTRKVDSLKSQESGAVKSILGIGLLEAAIKVGTGGLTLANAKNLLKQFGKTLSVLTIAYALIDYVATYNGAVNAWGKIPGSYYRW